MKAHTKAIIQRLFITATGMALLLTLIQMLGGSVDISVNNPACRAWTTAQHGWSIFCRIGSFTILFMLVLPALAGSVSAENQPHLQEFWNWFFQKVKWLPFFLLLVFVGLCGCAAHKVETPELQDGARLKYLVPLPDAAFQRAEGTKFSRTSLVVIPPSPWRSATVINEQPASMTNRWHPFTVIESSADLAAWTTRIIITNPQPFHEWMSNGYHCEFVPWTNTVTFPGQPQQFFRVP